MFSYSQDVWKCNLNLTFPLFKLSGKRTTGANVFFILHLLHEPGGNIARSCKKYINDLSLHVSYRQWIYCMPDLNRFESQDIGMICIKHCRLQHTHVFLTQLFIYIMICVQISWNAAGACLSRFQVIWLIKRSFISIAVSLFVWVFVPCHWSIQIP
jgi:hypothetical protein